MNGILTRQISGQRLQKIAPGLCQLGAAAISIALAAGSIFGGLHPFALGFIMGVSAPYVLSCAVGASAGYFLFLPITESLCYIAASAAALAGRSLFKKMFFPAAAGGSSVLLLVQLMLSVSGLSGIGPAISALGEAAVATGFGKALQALSRSKALRIGPVSAKAMLLGVALLPSLCTLPLGPFELSISLLGAAGLVLAYRGRIRECTTHCVVGAAIISAARPELSFAGLGLAAACLAAAWFTPGERTGSGAVFLIVCVFASLSAAGSVQAVGFLASAICAEGIFFLLPRHWLAALPGRAEGVLQDSRRPQLACAAGRVEQVAQALSEIAETVDKIYEVTPKKGETYNWVIDYVADELCRRCGRREACWVQDYSSTIDGFYRLKPTLQQQGKITVEKLPGQFCRCIHPVELCSTAGRAYTLFCSRRESRIKAGAMRAAVTEQYTAMAQALTGMAEQLGQSLAPDEGKTARIAGLFASIGLEPLETQIGYEATGRLMGSVTVGRTDFEPEELEELRKEIQKICHRPLGEFKIDHSGTVSVVQISEKAVYCPVFGVCAHEARQGVCGDATRQFCDAFGNAHLMLCDGMGTGKPAAIDGNLAASLAARLLKAGFSAQSAARLVNVALTLKSEEESAATLDLLSVDLFTGRAKLYKAGACPSFFVRAGKAEALEGSSLPVGILADVIGQQKTAALGEGGMAVLVSDGVLCDGIDWVCQQLELCAAVGSTPQEVADIIADTALRRAQSRGRPDDITVAVMRLERAG